MFGLPSPFLGISTIAAIPPTTHRDDSRLFADCQAVLGYEFRDEELLREALTHASGANHRLASNERLEFLGDAILGAVVCELLFRKYPDYQEGELTRIKSIVVSRRTCAKISESLSLEIYLFLGKGMGSQDQTPPSVLADMFESLIGAIFLDGGMEAAQRFIVGHIEPEIDAAVDGQNGLNYKSNLQHAAQRDFGATPTYLLLDEKGPDHSKCFKIAAQIGRNCYAPAWGRNKKEAEQRAAMNALCQLAGSPLPFESD
ncbi:MAG: ribonuclease III [Paludisphaera borealis]|uniref:ribonuclease III n=1 Tax=Paludisphaera borealis TaxID=1387353 RepID=UPI00284F2B09|nr:ribonuclease III [Paludisphaera borealis]MDR3621991.1 ribonuclease III [Paludisphaera borealis]